MIASLLKKLSEKLRTAQTPDKLSVIWANDPSRSSQTLKARIEKTKVMELSEAKHIGSLLFRPYSYVPSPHWETLSDEEYDEIISVKPQLYSHQIGITEVPESFLEKLWELGIKKITDRTTLEELFINPRFKEALFPIVDYASSFSTHLEGMKVLHIALNHPNLHTVTRQNPEGWYIGMHIDSWDYTDAPQDRKSTRNRFCVNLGKEDRYFLFCPFPVSSIDKLFKMNLFKDYKIHDFFRANPDIPIYRIRLSPNQAYIAPTENIIHDGSSLGQQYADLHFTILGYFNTVKNYKQIS